jgi:hypothetical protein
MRIEQNTSRELKDKLKAQQELTDKYVATAIRISEEQGETIRRLERENADLYATNQAFVRLING